MTLAWAPIVVVVIGLVVAGATGIGLMVAGATLYALRRIEPHWRAVFTAYLEARAKAAGAAMHVREPDAPPGRVWLPMTSEEIAEIRRHDGRADEDTDI